MPSRIYKSGSLVQGVSQQIPENRGRGQLESQLNCFSSTTNGITKRNGVDFISVLDDLSLTENAYIEIVNTNDNDYILIIDNNNVKVFSLDGTERTVTINEDDGYLNGSNFKSLVLGSTQLILNTDKVVSKGTELTSSRRPEALVWCKNGGFSKRFKITIQYQGVQYTSMFQSRDGSDISHTNDAQPEFIVQQLNANLNLPSDFNVYINDDVMYILNTANNDFSLQTSDKDGGQSLIAIKDSVKLFTDLPTKAPVGFKTNVLGEENGAIANTGYYIEYKRDGGVSSSSPIVPAIPFESSANGIISNFDLSTMPHGLVDNGDNTFTFGQVSYDERAVGDDDSASFPSFTGRKINNLFFTDSRLGFLYDNGLVLASVADLYNFFPSKVAGGGLASDPIDITSNSRETSRFLGTQNFQESLFIFSDNIQYILRDKNDGSGVLSKQLVEATRYNINVNADSTVNGDSLFFTSTDNNFSTLFEFSINEIANNRRASDVTSHAPNYIPKDVTRITSSANTSSVAMIDGSGSIFNYQFLWQPNDRGRLRKVQSAFHEYRIDGYEILQCKFIDDDLYMVNKRGIDGLILLEKISYENSLTDPEIPFIEVNGNRMKSFNISLDHRIKNESLIKSYDEGNDETSITCPYNVDEDKLEVVIVRANNEFGEPLVVKRIEDNVVYVERDFSDYELIIGNNFLAEFELSTIFLRDRSDISQSELRSHLRRLEVNHFASANYYVDIEKLGSVSRRRTFTGRKRGNVRNKFALMGIDDGTYPIKVGIVNENAKIKIGSENHLPMNITSITCGVDFVRRRLT